MSMIRRHRLQIVNSPKATSAIPAAKTLQRDLIIQSVLDPGVRTIEFCHQVVYAGRAVNPRSIVVNRDDGRFLLDLAGADRGRTPGETEVLDQGLLARGIARLAVAPELVRREPKCGNARLIWQYRDSPPSGRDRNRILDTLLERGPITIAELEADVSISGDLMSAVCALACDDILELDIDEDRLGPATVVRIRR